ncbi:MAG: hypothetical protein IKG03_05525 [Clostridiales bacterium]|nr:hypothetical protein [Clostridiales bacterium]
MGKRKETIQEQITEPAVEAGLAESEDKTEKESKVKHFWNYVTDYKRTTVALTLPSVTFDILYSGFCFTMSILSRSLWLFIMSIYYFLLCMLRVNVLYRAGRGAVFKSRRFSERVNYRKFSRNLILLDIVFAYAVYLIVRINIIHDYPGILIYGFGLYVTYKVLLAVINMFKAKKSRSLTALSLRKICIVDAMVSLLALEWAFSHRNEGNISVFASMIEKYIGIVVVVIIFIMGFAGFITCIRIKAKEKKEGKT